MPDVGYYEKHPRPESVDFFEKRIKVHLKVSTIEQLREYVYIVRRTGDMSDLTVYLTSIYALSETDVTNILLENDDVNCIINLSAWTWYTDAAKSLAQDRECGLFSVRQFMGAINFDGQEFLDYVPPKDRKGKS